MIVIDGYFPSLGGAEMQAGSLARVLADLGHEVKIVSPRLDPSMAGSEIHEGIPVERISYPRIRYVGAIILCLKFAWKLLRERNRFDAIHVHMAKNLATVAGFVRPVLDSCVVVKISGAWEFSGGILDQEKMRKPLYRIMNFFIKRSDYIQSISQFTNKMLVERGYPENKICMIPNGVDLSRFSIQDRLSEPHESSTIVVFTGRITPVKGVDVLIDAWDRLTNKRDALLLIAGDGPAREELEKSVHRMGLSGSVQFLGMVNDMPDLLRRADIYVQPSRQEGLPNSVLEAMAVGLPIVATRISGNEDLVEDGENGLLVPPQDPEKLAIALGELISDRGRRQRMGACSRKVVEKKYAFPVVADLLTKAYRLHL
jgi:glycosyltransferase involved in cell wall biosynthesis